ncbi:MAG: CusA/CzcA family heavy metal efflux RND transporter [Acidobacteria bacterium]|nr:CusA/CzcA family heavy metal efflux RND transporter [Acidobacteriota bacterium]
MNRLIELCLQYRFLVLALTAIAAITGVASLGNLTIDAVPDITPVQVQILTRAPALGPVEVEQYVTFPIEAAMTGIPGVREIRSVSRYGLSAVTIIFEDGFNLYLARQLVNERLSAAIEDIPPELGRPELGPMTTGLGEVYHFTVEGEGYTPMQLRTLLDWDIAFRLRSVPGVVEVNAWGGLAKQYHVDVDPAKLIAFGVTLEEVFEALQRNNANVGSGYIEHNQEQYIIRGEALVSSIQDLENIVVATKGEGVPIYVRTIGEAREGSMLRIGAATANGKGETVIGMVQMLAGANASQVVDDVKKKIDEIQASLPPGVLIVPFYDRADFVHRVIATVRNNLLEGGLLVMAVLLLLLGNFRAGLIVASAIPLSMLMAFTGMVLAGISGNLMSLGAIDFGLIVDGAVVMIENISRRLRGTSAVNTEARLARVSEAAREVVRPVVFAVGIIILVYVPILTLTGIEGKMFRPMAITVMFALMASLVLAVTLMPVLGSLFLREESHEEPWLLRKIRAAYEPALAWAMRHPRSIGASALAVFASSALVFFSMGAEFIPRLDEGDIAINAWRLPSISLQESVASTTQIERILGRFPEVKTVVSRTGSPEVATDVMGIELSDVFVILKPRSEWTTAKTKEELVAKMNEALQQEVPGAGYGFTQPIEMRFNELIAGVRSDVGVRIFGDDLEVLAQKGSEVAQVLSTVAGAEDVRVEQTAGLPMIRIAVDRPRLARYGLNAADVLSAVEATRVGKVVGTIFEGQRRFDLVVRLPEEVMSNPDAIANIPVANHARQFIPLAQVADIRLDTGPAQVSRQNVQRRLVVECNVRGRDLGSFVAEAQKKIAQSVSLPSGYYVEWGGQFEQLQEARERLAIVVPVALLLIFLILYMAFGAVRPALLIFLNVPLAATGGVYALALRGLPFSISAAVGFIALFGIAVLNGVVLVTYINQLRQEGRPLEEAIAEGAKTRLRPVLMTAMVASFGFVPMAVATSMGAEVQRPLATVVIGGLVTSTLLTLLVLPTIYRWFEQKSPEVEI